MSKQECTEKLHTQKAQVQRNLRQNVHKLIVLFEIILLCALWVILIFLRGGVDIKKNWTCVCIHCMCEQFSAQIGSI